MRFVTYSPNWNDRSAGVNVLHRLSHWLGIYGHDSSLTCNILNPDWETRYFENQMTDDTIVIYPEIVEQNPLNAKRVVRLCLSHPGHPYHGTPTSFGQTDLAMVYAERFRPATEAAFPDQPVHRLFVSVYPADVFFPWDGQRDHDLFYIGRGRNAYDAFRDRVDLSNAHEFTSVYPNRYEIGKALRRCRRFINFDQVCALLAESSMCGAVPVFVRDDGTVIECVPDSVELMGVNEEGARFDQSGDVEGFLRLCEQQWLLPSG